MINHFARAVGTDDLRTRVHNCQVGCISLINRLTYYMDITADLYREKEEYTDINNRYSDLRRVLISHLAYLGTYYFPFIDTGQPVPAIILQGMQESIKSKIEHLQLLLSQSSADPGLVDIVLGKLLFVAKQTSLLYRQVYYYQSLLEDLQVQYDNTQTPPLFQIPLDNFLIRKNFNHPVFIDYMGAKLRRQAEESATVEEQADKWSFHLKEFTWLTTVSSSAYPEYSSVKDALVIMSEKELQYLQNRIRENGKMDRSAPQREEGAGLITALTVSQLGVFMRLLTDLGILRHQNQAELLRMVAGTITTTKKAHISAESLRVRYYNPDKASIAITKEYLLQMLNRLKEY